MSSEEFQMLGIQDCMRDPHSGIHVVWRGGICLGVFEKLKSYKKKEWKQFEFRPRKNKRLHSNGTKHSRLV